MTELLGRTKVGRPSRLSGASSFGLRVGPSNDTQTLIPGTVETWSKTSKSVGPVRGPEGRKCSVSHVTRV